MESDMHTDRLKKCIYCGCLFIPSRKHPHQQCCRSIECCRIQDKLRQRRFAAKRNKDSVRRRANCERKSREYLRRKENCLNATCPPKEPRPHVTSHSVGDYFIGMLQIVTQENDADRLYVLLDRCREAGRSLRL